MTQAISEHQIAADLRKELKRYSGFLNPEPVKSKCSDAVDLLSQKKSPFPIVSSDNKIILAISSIFENKKILKMANPLILMILSILQNDFIKSGALALIIRKFEESINEIEPDSILKLIQYSTTAITQYFLDLSIFQSLLYIDLYFADRPDEILRTTGFAASNQIITSFLQFAFSSRDTLTPDEKRTIDLCLSSSILNDPPDFNKTAKPNQKSISTLSSIDKEIYVVVRDLVNLATGIKPKWLHIESIQPNTAYSLLKHPFINYHDFFIKDERFLNLVSVSVSKSLLQKAPLDFIVPVFDLYLDAIPPICLRLFSDFIDELKPTYSQFVKALIFFHTLIINSNGIVAKIMSLDTASVLSALVTALRSVSETTIGSDSFPVSLNPRQITSFKISHQNNIVSREFQAISDSYLKKNKINIPPNSPNSPNQGPSNPNAPGPGTESQISEIEKQNLSEEKTLKAAAPVEITAFITQQCYSSDRPSVRNLVSKIWPDILGVISLALSPVEPQTCYILMQALHALLELSRESKLNQCRGSVVATLCSLLSGGSGKEREPPTQLQNAAYDTMTSALESHPTCFTSHWSRVLDSLAIWSWKPDSINFTKTMNDADLTEFSLGLISGREKKWALELLVETLIANSKRFEFLWQAVDGYFCLLIDDHEFENIALTAFLSLLHDGFTADSEGCLCKTLEGLFRGRRRLATEPRSRILTEVQLMLAQKGLILKNGWTYLLNSLSPENFRDEGDILNSSFRCIQIICNDLMFSLPENTQEQCVKVFFRFVSQQTDINVSLSAFGLIWNVVSVAKTSEMWQLIFDQASLCIRDPRNDVAQCAIRTFFSLISSNASVLNQNCFIYLVKSCFIPLIDFLSVKNDHTAFLEAQAFKEKEKSGSRNSIVKPETILAVDQFIEKEKESKKEKENKKNKKDKKEKKDKKDKKNLEGAEMGLNMNSGDIPPEHEPNEKDSLEEYIDSYESSGDREATQQLAFHELAHCGKILWAEFEKEPLFYQLWLNLFEEHEIFIKKCSKREIIFGSFQFYEEVFRITKFSDEQIFILFDSFDRIADFFIGKEKSSSPVFGQFGKVIREVLPDQSPDRSNDQNFDKYLDRWLKLIRNLIVNIDSGNFTPPTAHKSLDALELLFPRSEDLTCKIYKEFVDYALMPDKHLTQIALDHMKTICEMESNQKCITKLFMLSRSVLNLTEARSLLLIFTENDISFEDETIPAVFASLIELGDGNKLEIAEKVGIALIKLFPRLTIEEKKKFTSSRLGIITAINIWKKFFNPDSQDFMKESANECAILEINRFQELIKEANETDLIVILKFLIEINSDFEALKINAKGVKRHLYLLLPSFGELTLSPNNEIRSLIRDILNLIASEPI